MNSVAADDDVGWAEAASIRVQTAHLNDSYRDQSPGLKHSRYRQLVEEELAKEPTTTMNHSQLQ